MSWPSSHSSNHTNLWCCMWIFLWTMLSENTELLKFVSNNYSVVAFWEMYPTYCRTFLWCQNQQADFQWEKVPPSGWSARLLGRYWIRKAAISQHLLVSLKSAVIPFTERFKLGLCLWLPEGVQAYWKGKKWPVRDDQIIQRASVKRQCMIIRMAVREAWNRFVVKKYCGFAYGI